VDEDIEADENMEGTDDLKDDSNQPDLIKGEYDSDSEREEHEQGGDQLFEDGSEIPLLQGVSLVIISYRNLFTSLSGSAGTMAWCVIKFCLENIANFRKVQIWVPCYMFLVTKT